MRRGVRKIRNISVERIAIACIRASKGKTPNQRRQDLETIRSYSHRPVHIMRPPRTRRKSAPGCEDIFHPGSKSRFAVKNILAKYLILQNTKYLQNTCKMLSSIYHITRERTIEFSSKSDCYHQVLHRRRNKVSALQLKLNDNRVD